MTRLLPVSMIIATADRSEVLYRTLASAATQHAQPAEIILADASADYSTKALLEGLPQGLASDIIYKRVNEKGAAHQRNAGFQITRYDTIGFMDDDIILEPGCFDYMWEAMKSDTKIGGVNALVTNQHYTRPGFVSSVFFRVMNGKKEASYAGKVFGPAINLLPADDASKGDVMDVEWLNSTLTLYKKEALPDPVFDSHFTGYSFMEDLSLSLRVARQWRVVTARKARIFHDSQPSKEKQDITKMAAMELINRHYIVTKVMGDTSLKTSLKLFLHQFFVLITTKKVFNIPFYRGKWIALRQIMKSGR